MFHDFPMKTGDFPWLCKRLPEGIYPIKSRLNHHQTTIFPWFSYWIPVNLFEWTSQTWQVAIAFGTGEVQGEFVSEDTLTVSSSKMWMNDSWNMYLSIYIPAHAEGSQFGAP